MFENWLKPLDEENLPKQNRSETSFGNYLLRNQEGLENLKQIKLAILGIGEIEANLVRGELYKMSFPFAETKIADLGNFRREESTFVLPVIKDLLDGGICPIIIGKHDRLVVAQFEAHQSVFSSVGTCSIDEKLAYHPEQNELEGYFQNPIVQSKHLFHLSSIGCQTHFIESASLELTERKNFDLVRLGKAKTSLSEVEPIIRDADMLGFHLRALKNTDAPGVEDSTPSGFFSEEACQLCRYAGMSDKLTSIGFYGFREELDIDNQTSKTLAQMIWYFIDGYCNRKNDFPSSLDGLMEYIVDFKGHDYQLTFWKSNKTGRWWMQVPVKTKKKHNRHRLISCSYNDYVLASQEDIPERLINAHKRFE